MPLLTDHAGRPLVVTTHGHGRPHGHRRRETVRITRATALAFAAVQAVLGLSLLLEFFHADGTGGIIGVLSSVTNLLVAPARLLAHRHDVAGQYTLDVPILIAMVGYFVLQLALTRLLVAVTERRRAPRDVVPPNTDTSD